MNIPLIRKRIHQGISKFHPNPRKQKHHSELAYWLGKQSEEGTFSRNHFIAVCTSLFSLDTSDYADRTVLDIGCGPRGSLEWATMTTEAIGLDPLATTYNKINPPTTMTYVDGTAEAIPYPNAYFDITIAINALDHVHDVGAAIGEISRVTKPGGKFLLLVEVNHEPTVNEPQTLDWDITDQFKPMFSVEFEEHREFDPELGHHSSTTVAPVFDHDNDTDRAGVLLAKLTRE